MMEVPGDVLKLLGEDGFRIMTQLSNNIYETTESPKDFTEAKMTALKKPKATQCSHHCTISLIAHATKIVMRILRLKGKLSMYLEKISLDSEEEKELGMQLGC
jgi:hypothetical protein